MGGHGWGKVDEEQLLGAVGTALDLGVRLFDTSDVYGLGISETLLGRALRGRRDEAVIATKFGVRHQNGRTFHDTSVEWIHAAIDGSLQRLGVERVDLYQMHYWDGLTPVDEIVGVLESLLLAGKIRAYGITNHAPRDPAFRGRDTELGSYSYQYSMVHRRHEAEILSVQREPGPVFLSWGSLGQGILSGKYRSAAQLDPADRRQREVYSNFHGEQLVAVQRVLDEMRVISAEAGIPNLVQLALRWIIDYVPRSIALVGIKRPDQIIDAAAVLNLRLDASTSTRLDRLTEQFGVSSATI